MKLAKALSRRIKELREASGLSQQEVATRGELSLSQVAKLEQGKKADPRASTLLALARALGVRPGQLLDDLFPTSQKDTTAVALPLPLEPTANGDSTTVEAFDKPKASRKKKKEREPKKKKKKTG
jgi:transcriptional regulator with XRE-family HTH domain